MVINKALSVTLLLSMSAHAIDLPSSVEELEHYPKSVQKLMLQIRDYRRAGGMGIKPISFRETNYQYSLTQISKNSSDVRPFYFAFVVPKENGGGIAFSTEHPCLINDEEDPLSHTTIRVNDTNVFADILCLENSEPNALPKTTMEFFTVRTNAGIDYTARQFLQNPYVFVDLGSGEIPFATDGFYDLWQRTNQPAL